MTTLLNYICIIENTNAKCKIIYIVLSLFVLYIWVYKYSHIHIEKSLGRHVKKLTAIAS